MSITQKRAMPRFQLSKPIGIFYEHQQWFLPLFDKLNEQGIPYVPIDARSHSYDPRETEDRYSLFFNRMSASACLRGHGNTIFYTLNYLAHVERSGIPIVNGRTSFMFETSKALQVSASVVERVAAFEAAGVDLLLLQCSPQYEEMERFAEAVIKPTPHVKFLETQID